MAKTFKTTTELVASWLGSTGQEVKEIMTPELTLKCHTFFEKMLQNGGSKNMPQRYRSHLVDFVKYNVPGDWFSNSMLSKGHCAVTKEKMTALYGPIEGDRRWSVYCQKQADTNTFEYKHQKYGMTRDEFESYNNSRAVTLENMVKRHGVETGQQLFQKYCTTQKDAGTSLSYFQEQYGDIEGQSKYDTVCDQKRLTLSNFIRKYGEEEGRKEYDHFAASQWAYYSKKSQRLFWDVMNQIDNKDKVHFAELNKEFGVYDDGTDTYRKFDFVISDIKLAVEFDGDHYHGNPALYKPLDKLRGRGCTSLTATEKWDMDAHKCALLEARGFTVLRIWESDYDNDPVSITSTIVKEIHRRNGQSSKN
jgi:very-short-patch-repair endonuclease